MLLDDSDESIIRDFMKISESALNEYWLNEEEDEAWKNLEILQEPPTPPPAFKALERGKPPTINT